MINFKYTDASNTIAFRVLDNGGMESCFASALPPGTVIDPADPAPPPAAPRFTSLEFLDLFTDDEQIAVATAAMQSATVKLWYDKMLAASYITLDDPRTEAGLQGLVSATLISASRKAEIVAAMAPRAD